MLHTPASVEVRRLRDDDSIEAITALLHLAYAPLAAQGFRYLATHQSEDVTRHRLGEGIALVAQIEKRIIATLTVSPPKTASRCEWYRRSGVWSLGQFGVHPDFQGSGIGRRLMAEAEKIAMSQGAQELALDTAEDALHLVNWYQRIGFVRVQFVDWDETNYRSVVLSKRLTADAD